MTPAQRIRFARHRSLVELGDAGQQALLDATAGAPLSDARAEHVRAEYLSRAGVSAREQEARAVQDVDVAAFAGVPYLVEAAANCLGALAAVERIKQITGAGRAATLPLTQKLAKES